MAVLGLHAVFEHHDAQGTEAALAAFLHEYRIPFPVGIDRPSETEAVPETMRAYSLQGTPSLILIDREGRRRAQHFGSVTDLRLGAEIMALIGERPADLARPEAGGGATSKQACDDAGCPAP